jgi:hypothetical protein
LRLELQQATGQARQIPVCVQNQVIEIIIGF